MKAAVLKNWFDLELTDIPVPVPNDREALIKIRYGGVCGSDMTVYRGKHMTATVPTGADGSLPRNPREYCLAAGGL